MKITKSISRGMSLACDGFYQAYSTNTFLYIFAILSVLFGIPAFAYLVNFVSANPSMMLFVSSQHISMLKDLSGPVDLSKVGSLFFAGLLAAPFVGFFYGGVVKGLTSKKRYSIREAVNVGTTPLKTFNFWVLAVLVAAPNIYLMSMIDVSNVGSLINLLYSPTQISLDMFICVVACVATCFALVGYLLKKSGIILALTDAFRLILGNFLEVISGILTWLFISLAGYMAIQWTLNVTDMQIKTLGSGIFLNNIKVMLFPVEALWIFTVAIAWIAFVYNINKK